jgi:peroxiredoxin
VARELAARGGKLFAVSVDTPELSQGVVQKRDLPFSILSDEGRTLIRAWHLAHVGGAPDGGDVAIPAQILIAKGGRVVWKHVSQRVDDRVDPADVLARVRAL